MQQAGDENTSLSVVEDPCKDDCQCYDKQKKNGEAREEGSEAGAWPSAIIGRQELQQNARSPTRHPGAGYPAVAHSAVACGAAQSHASRFPRAGQSQERWHKGQRIAHQQDGGETLKARNQSWLDNDSKQEQCADADEAEYIPLPAGAPLRNPVP